MKLKELCQEYLISIGDQNFNRFSRILPIAVSGLRELNMDVAGQSQFAHFPISDIDTIALPAGYIRYVRIGLCGSDGNIHSLGINGDMCKKRETNDCGQITNNTATTEGEDEIILTGWDGFADNYRNGELVGRMFGVGGGNSANGYYRVDSARGVIQLSNLPANTTEAVLEWIGEIEVVDGSYEVHPFICETLKAWIRWQMKLNNPTSQLGAIQLMEDNYRKNYMTSVRRFSSGTLEEWIAAIRFGAKTAPHY